MSGVDYSEALELFKEIYLYPGYKDDIRNYAISYAGRGSYDEVRDDSYSKCINYNEKGIPTWKIVSPRNIFGLELKHVVDHKNHNKVTSNLILNSGRFDISRMTSFAEVDVTEKEDSEILEIVENILSKPNRKIIEKFGIKEDSMGILTSSIIADSVLQYLETQNLEKAPNIECDGEDGSITITADEILEGSIKITKSKIEADEQYIKYKKVGNFPNCKFEIEGLKGDSGLINHVFEGLNKLNTIEDRNKLVGKILGLALTQFNLNTQLESAKDLYKEYLQVHSGEQNRNDEDRDY